MSHPTLRSLRQLLAAGAAGLALVAASGAAQAQVGVSVSVNQPGVYGRIDIGHVPTPPVVVYQQPMVVMPGPVAVQRAPIYLHVPPGHYKNWKKHCSRYAACGQPVYFVQDGWYQTYYAPSHRPPHYHSQPGYHPRPDYRPQPPHARPPQHHHHSKRDDRRRDDHRGNGRGRGHDRD